MLNEEHQLIGLIYEAALDTSLWPKVLEQIVKTCNGNTAIVTALDNLNPNFNFAFTHNITPEILEAYVAGGMATVDMELHGAILISQGLGQPKHVGTVPRMRNDEPDTPTRNFYDYCLKGSNIFHIVGVLLEYDAYRWSVLGVHRPETDPEFSMKELDWLKKIAVHIRRSLQIHRQFSVLNRKNAQLYEVFDQMTVGVILLNNQQKVCYTNSKAEKLLTSHGGLKLDKNNCLKTSANQQAALSKTIKSAMPQGNYSSLAESGGIVGLYDDEGASLLTLTITPLSIMGGYNQLIEEHTAAAIFLSDITNNHTLSHQLLKQLYNLSKREIEVCQSFVNTASLEQTGAELSIAIGSVRTYMKNIYEKTQQRSQAELLHLLIGLTDKFEHIN